MFADSSLLLGPAFKFLEMRILPEESGILINRSGILKQFPEIDLEKNKVGIFSKLSKLDAVLNDVERVEIYTRDPKTVPRKSKGGDAAYEE